MLNAVTKQHWDAANSALMSVADDEGIEMDIVADVPVGEVFAGTFMLNSAVFVFAARRSWRIRNNGEIAVSDITAFTWHEDIMEGIEAVELSRTYIDGIMPCYMFEHAVETYAAAGAASDNMTMDQFHETMVEELRNNG
jgi:hypothetical protein